MRLILVMATAALALVPPSVQLAALRRGERLASTPSSAKPPRTRLASAPTPSTKPKPKNRGKKKPQKKKRGARPRGSVANVHWRAIPARALRSHPAYLGLPPSQSVCGDADLARAALFRQDTWRWDALHAGRLTGSRVAAVCGLLEASAAETLRIPKSLASHGRALRAAMHLRERPDASLLKAVFRDEEHDDDEDAGEWRENDASPFAYDWMGAPDTGGRRCGDPMAARLSWGKTQEGIGMLAAVNHVRGSVAELGLLCAEPPGAVDCLAESWPVKPRTTAPSRKTTRKVRGAATGSGSATGPRWPLSGFKSAEIQPSSVRSRARPCSLTRLSRTSNTASLGSVKAWVDASSRPRRT